MMTRSEPGEPRTAAGRRGLAALAVLTVVLALGSAGSPAAGDPQKVSEPALFDPRRPPERELDMSIEDGFTLAAVGDCIISRPLSPMLERDPDFAGVVALLRRADVTFGNFETVAIDIRSFDGHALGGTGDWPLISVPEVAADLALMGFDLLSRANNHSMDWGFAGLRETDRWLDEAGLVHAGAGAGRAVARAPRYLETSKGRLGLVSFASTYGAVAEAMPAKGQAPGRPGISALKTHRIVQVTPEMMKQLTSLRDAIRAERRACEDTASQATSSPEELTLFGTRFRLGDSPAYHYEVDVVDLAEILKSIRQGKQHSDFMVVSIHAHEQALGCSQPGDFLPTVAHAAIDAGADAVIGHGVHRLMPIEIYKARPIFYSLANFFWSDIQEPLTAELYEQNRDRLGEAFPDPTKATDADLAALLNASGFDDDLVFQTVVAVSRYDGGTLSEIRLHPVDLGYGRRLTQSGVPRLASPETSRAILERLQRISGPFGTSIAVEGGIGIIRPRHVDSEPGR